VSTEESASEDERSEEGSAYSVEDSEEEEDLVEVVEINSEDDTDDSSNDDDDDDGGDDDNTGDDDYDDDNNDASVDEDDMSIDTSGRDNSSDDCEELSSIENEVESIDDRDLEPVGKRNPNLSNIQASFMDDEADIVQVDVRGKGRKIFRLGNPTQFAYLEKLLASKDLRANWRMFAIKKKEKNRSRNHGSYAPGFLLPSSEEENSKSEAEKEGGKEEEGSDEEDEELGEELDEEEAAVPKKKGAASKKGKNKKPRAKQVQPKKKQVKEKKTAGCKPAGRKKKGDDGDDADDVNDGRSKQKATKSSSNTNGKRSKGATAKNSNNTQSGGRGVGGRKNGNGTDQDEEVKGKNEAEDSDSMGSDILGDTNDEVVARLNQQLQDRMKKPVNVFVSDEIESLLTDSRVSMGMFARPGGTFMCKAEFMRQLLTSFHEKKMIGNVNNIPEWISSVRDVKIRATEHGLDSRYKRSGNKNNTTEIIVFVVKVPISGMMSQAEAVKGIVEENFFRLYKKRVHNTMGELVLKYTEQLPKGDGGGLHGFCLRKGGGNPKEAAKVMTAEIHDHFKDGPNYVWGTSLDRFLVDWDIREFLTEHVGIESWADLDDKGKKICYKNYPRRSLPEWNSIVQESCFEFRLGISGAYNVVLLDQTDFDCFAQYVKLGVAF